MTEKKINNPENEADQPDEISADSQEYCPTCQRPINENAKHCLYCGGGEDSDEKARQVLLLNWDNRWEHDEKEANSREITKFIILHLLAAMLVFAIYDTSLSQFPHLKYFNYYISFGLISSGIFLRRNSPPAVFYALVVNFLIAVRFFYLSASFLPKFGLAIICSFMGFVITVIFASLLWRVIKNRELKI